MTGPLLKFSDKFFDVIDDIWGPVSEKLMKIENDWLLDNYLKISLVDISKLYYNIEVTIDGKKEQMNVAKFIRYILPGEFTDKEIADFIKNYNRVIRGLQPIEQPKVGKKVEVVDFKFNPKDVKSTFLSLTQYTYPHGHEEELLKFLPSDLKKDKFGNYYKIIGESETMFTSHLDTADRKQEKVTVHSIQKDGDEILMTDGTSILGADDKSGVTVMLYLMAHNIPGLYYFFIGEEVGGIGSHKLAAEFDKFDYLKNIKRCVSFDRRNYHSVITHQSGRQCCSDEFAKALIAELNSAGMSMEADSKGIYTDSASFIDDISECTNISVGYFDEHRVIESQNISFLKKLADACIKVKWETLPTIKKVGIDDEVLKIYGPMIREFKSTPFNLSAKIVTEWSTTYIKMELDDPDVDLIHGDLILMNSLLNKFNLNPDIYFDDQSIKIELKTK